MGSIAGKLLLVALAALAAGASITDQKTRLKVGGGALLIFLLIAAMREDLDTVGAVYLWILVFAFPFQFGHWLQRRAERWRKK